MMTAIKPGMYISGAIICVLGLSYCFSFQPQSNSKDASWQNLDLATAGLESGTNASQASNSAEYRPGTTQEGDLVTAAAVDSSLDPDSINEQFAAVSQASERNQIAIANDAPALQTASHDNQGSSTTPLPQLSDPSPAAAAIDVVVDSKHHPEFQQTSAAAFESNNSFQSSTAPISGFSQTEPRQRQFANGITNPYVWPSENQSSQASQSTVAHVENGFIAEPSINTQDLIADNGPQETESEIIQPAEKDSGGAFAIDSSTESMQSEFQLPEIGPSLSEGEFALPQQNDDPATTFPTTFEPIQADTQLATQQQPEQQPEQQPTIPTPESTPVVNERVQAHINYGQSLARRGSLHSARQEFIQALSLIAEFYDMQANNRQHTSDLAEALTALRESQDFIPDTVENQLSMNVATIVDAHSTKIIEPSQAQSYTPIHAMQAYYTYATEKLTSAAGQSRVASQALHSLGILLTANSKFDSTGEPLDRAQAMVMFQAAVNADNQNYKSANELGILLAQNGRLQQAKENFKNSLKSKRSPKVWKNLAIVHQKLGEQELAQLAMGEYETMFAAKEAVAGGAGVQWVSPAEFDAQAAMPALTTESAQQRIAQTPAETTSKPKTKKRLLKTIKDWF